MYHADKNRLELVEVEYHYVGGGIRTAVVELTRGGDAIMQLKHAFKNTFQLVIAAHCVDLSLDFNDASTIITTAEQVFKNMRNRVDTSYYCEKGLPQLRLYASIDDQYFENCYDTNRYCWSNQKKIQEEAEKKAIADRLKNMKDAMIAEEQMAIRALVEKQQQDLAKIYKEMAEFKVFMRASRMNASERESLALNPNPELHKAMCDKCNGAIIGHRFKCTLCEDYDLCAKCELTGAHPYHAMLRIVNKDTRLPDEFDSDDEGQYARSTHPDDEVYEEEESDEEDEEDEEKEKPEKVRVMKIREKTDEEVEEERRQIFSGMFRTPPSKIVKVPKQQQPRDISRGVIRKITEDQLGWYARAPILAEEERKRREREQAALELATASTSPTSSFDKLEDESEEEEDEEEDEEEEEFSFSSSDEDLEIFEEAELHAAAQEDGLKTALEPEDEDGLHTACPPTPELPSHLL